jgi:hypothetical protein
LEEYEREQHMCNLIAETHGLDIDLVYFTINGYSVLGDDMIDHNNKIFLTKQLKRTMEKIVNPNKG